MGQGNQIRGHQAEMIFDMYCSGPDRDSGFRPKAGEQPAQVRACESNASRRGRAIGPRDMEKNRAAPPGNPRPRIVVDLDQEIVQPIGPPQPVPSRRGRPTKGTVVAAVRSLLAPGKVRRDTPDREQCRRAGMAVGSPPQPDEPKSSARSSAVALELVGTHPASAEHDRDRMRTSQQDSSGPAAGPYPDPNQGETTCSHEDALVPMKLAPPLQEAIRLRFYARMIYFAQSRDTNRMARGRGDEQ
jgi:hypothetical protein